MKCAFTKNVLLVELGVDSDFPNQFDSRFSSMFKSVNEFSARVLIFLEYRRDSLRTNAVNRK